MTPSERARQREEDKQYREGRCEMCGSLKRDHGVGGVCPSERGASDLRGYDLGPRR